MSSIRHWISAVGADRPQPSPEFHQGRLGDSRRGAPRRTRWPTRILITALGVGLLALMVAGERHVSAWSLTPAITIAGAGIGLVFGQLFDVVLTGVAETGDRFGLRSSSTQPTARLRARCSRSIWMNLRPRRSTMAKEPSIAATMPTDSGVSAKPVLRAENPVRSGRRARARAVGRRQGRRSQGRARVRS
jgi:hypothetical protein